MAMERSTAEVLPLQPHLSASPPSSPATVGALLTNAACASRIRRECRSPRSLLSRILGRGSGGFGCRMRIPRYCSSGAGAAAKEDAVEEEAAAPKVVMAAKQETEVRESPRSSLQGMKAAPDVSAASFGLGAGLVLLLSRGAVELSRMSELRAQMERLVMDVRAEARGSSRSDVSDGHADDGASVVKERIVFADAGGGEDASLSRGSRDAASACGDAGVGNAAAAMDQMEAELEAELTRLQLDSDDDDEEECVRPRQDHQLESEAKSDISSESGSLACVHIDGVLGDAARDCKEHEYNEEEEEEEDEEVKESKPCHGGVPARVLERRLHELLQSRHEQRIAELETELQRAQRKLRDKEREVSRWRDTAKLVSRHKDESRLR
ncbi:protein POLAR LOCALIZATION DURING ASYMMETRIC DIVISION AND REDISTRIBUTION-like [Triticum dicoccoides]|uniref:protein POLAR LOCALIZATION DURING ASYMMETRIC DIVISION AND REDISTRIBUTION-like n=1 Tax=Triticum dicoccoides TaxID=85692 RepID=UPI001891DEA9|nr:protein POLAR LOCALIZATION DURING ASYMMETRIC DIVISION AND REDISTRIBUTION-like [Triticum dicoccoides]